MTERKRRRLFLGLALGLALALGVAWQAGKRLLDVDQYRSLVATQLEGWIGLPVTIGRLDLALRPIPVLVAFDVSIGRGELQAVAERIHLLPALGALWERRLEIFRVDLDALVLTLPADPERLQSHWDALVQRIAAASQRAPTASLWSSWLDGFALHRVRADDIDVRLGEGGPWLRTSVRVRGLADPDVDVDLDTHLPAFGTRITGRLHIPQEAGAGSELRGDFQLRTAWPDDTTGVPEALQSRLEATALLEGDPKQALRLAVDGTLEPQAARAFSGKVSGEVRLADGALGADFVADGPELRLHGSARSLDDGAAELRIDSLEAGHAGVTALLEWLGTEFVELSASENGALELREVALRFGPNGGAPGIVSGSLSAKGLEAGLAGRSLAREIVLEAEATETGVTIRTLRGGPFDLAGELDFEPDWSQFELAVRGDIALTPDLLDSAGVTGLENVSGRIRLEELRQTFPARAMRDALPALRARVTNAALRVAGDGFSDELSGIDLLVTTEGAVLRGEGRARSRALGQVNASAAWEVGTREGRGRVAIDPAAAEGFGSPELWEVVAPLIDAWGSGVEVAASWPEERGSEVSLRLDRSEAPSLHAQLALRPDDAEGVLGDVEVDALVPAHLLEALLPPDVETRGSAAVALQRDAARATFVADADLAALSLRSGRFVHKRAGEVLRVQVEGEAPAQGLHVKRLALVSAKQTLPFEWRGERLVASDLDVDLGAWSFLLAEGSTASGRLRGAFATHPLDARLALSDVGLRLSPDMAIDAADGRVALSDAGWSVHELRVRGAGSDVVVDAAHEGERIEGRIAGASLDVDLVRALIAEVRALLPEPEQNAAPMRGTLAVKLDRVRAGRSEARGLATEIRFDGGDVHVPAFDLETYEGRVSGAIHLVAQPDAPRRLDLALDVANVTGRFLDDFFFEQAPRDIRGVFSGKLAFSAPFADDVKAMLAAGDGRLSWSARDGSFGKLGFATKITTALRASQALRMRLPALKDEGLVFDTVKADFPMQKGRLQIELFELDTTSYAISALGSLDFALDRSDVPIELNATKGLTAFLDKLPVAGDALQIVNVRLQATGSPYDLTVRMASFKEQVVRASLAGPKSMIKRVRDAVALAKRLNGKPAEPGADAVPALDAKPESAAEAMPEPEMVPEPGAVPEPEMVPEPGAVPEPEMVPEPGAVPEPEMVPEPGAVPEPEMVPEPEVDASAERRSAA